MMELIKDWSVKDSAKFCGSVNWCHDFSSSHMGVAIWVGLH